jgi:uncharacterized protein (TIGR02466 family)
MITDIFSVGISIFELRNINNNEIAEYAKTKSEKHLKKENKDILSNIIFKGLNEVVLKKMNEYYSSIYNGNYKIKIHEAWSNKGDDTYITIPHSHNGSTISSVYYPHSTEGEIVFLNPGITMTNNQSIEMVDTHNKYTSEYYTFPARTGHLIIFNSMLQHMVRCKTDERISIAYNGITEGV